MNQKKIRYDGIDILRVLALVLVLIVHFFLNTSYYTVSTDGFLMKIQIMIRNFSMICVPLFIMITGFLNKKAEYNQAFFKGLFHILFIWFFYSLLEYYVFNLLNNQYDLFNLKNFLFSLTSFQASGYSWYIEMYIGLYFMTPIINIAYQTLNKKNQTILLILSIFSCILPTFINAMFQNLIHIPSYWINMYPICYYISGKYIADQKPNYSKKNLILLLLLTQILSFSFQFVSFIDYNSLFTYINAVIIFLLFYQVNLKHEMWKKIILYLSNITLDMYLISSLIDKIIYPIFNNILNKMKITQANAILFLPIILFFIFLITFLCGSIRKKLIHIR